MFIVREIMLYLTNSLTGKKEEFKPITPGRVLMYVCGVTPYDHAHVGHGRCYITFDVLYRLLKFLSYDVTYCRNFTDIDDKILNKAEKEFGDRQRYKDITARYIASYHADMGKINCLLPTYEPRVTETIQPIIDFITGLIEQGKAYAVAGDVYFRINTFPEYGKLSKHKLEDLRAGERVEVNSKKEDPLDFVLWKSESEGTFWKSPWGYGRPGWHIECSAMASKYLAPHIDIHAGGLDLMFPHHDNEIAQSEALQGAPFARYWVHNGFVQVNKEKMSKSLGNFFMLQDVFKQFDPMVVRYYILTHQYRTPLDFSFDDMKATQKSYERLCRIFEHVEPLTAFRYEDVNNDPIMQALLTFLCDDMNTPGMFGVLFEKLSEIQSDAQCARMVKSFLMNILGLRMERLPEPVIEITPEVQALIDARNKARAEKNWGLADEIRDQLQEMGIDLKDKKL
jgi:cysteinyl-tRNA synthetase